MPGIHNTAKRTRKSRVVKVWASGLREEYLKKVEVYNAKEEKFHYLRFCSFDLSVRDTLKKTLIFAPPNESSPVQTKPTIFRTFF
ncbi:hypothetical protein Forpe1208_v002397 [Fusarium oxysporum f. sp. rapae]|uniref:Uncharacterized protein n=1 Tax=Fusarium oxysporum f. sp. rapae TaxID=485398 RepID=A0A8J5P5J2_FUSOX|nr:hypothetical protein Forpe1208_v002397 [Fusarium oxysporum f. sp. rapae]